MSLNKDAPICVPCERNFKPIKNGIVVKLHEDAYIASDLWGCGCGAQIIDRKGHGGIIERHDPATSRLFELMDAKAEGRVIFDPEHARTLTPAGAIRLLAEMDLDG